MAGFGWGTLCEGVGGFGEKKEKHGKVGGFRQNHGLGFG